MKKKFNAIKTRIESKINKFEEGVCELKHDIKRAFGENPDRAKGWMIIIGLISLIGIARAHNKNWFVSFMNRNHHHTYLNGVRINPKRLTKRTAHKYQRLINRGYDVYEAANKAGLCKK